MGNDKKKGVDRVNLNCIVNSGHYALKWMKNPHTVLIVKKPNDLKTEKALVELAK
jgi:hypothetical protein